jgi:hypothetical protein
MSVTPYDPPKPPKTITKIQEDAYLDFTSPFTWVLMGFVGFALFIILQIGSVQNSIFQAILVLILVIWLIIWLKYFSTSEKVEKQFLMYGFNWADIRGKHVINKFEVPAQFLEKIVPIVKIHAGGIIEFKGKKWGILMETNPIRISDEERAAHEKKIEKVVNGIPANTHFKTIACSKLQPRKPIQQYLLEVSDNSNGKKATDQHLAGLYTKVAEDGTPVISWKYYAFQSLGEHPNFETARIQYGAVVPGLLKNMRAARLQPRIYEDPNEIATAYRTMFSEMVV